MLGRHPVCVLVTDWMSVQQKKRTAKVIPTLFVDLAKIKIVQFSTISI